MAELTHLNESGKARMVDVSDKDSTYRTASARGVVRLSNIAYNAVKSNTLKKGDALSVAKIAGIQAAKKTSELIPLCHNIFISQIDLDFIADDSAHTITIISNAKTDAKTGIEMEALTAVSVAALTIYDMCKSADKSIQISAIELICKTGGKSGDYYE